jgi:hypothetical protein
VVRLPVGPPELRTFRLSLYLWRNGTKLSLEHSGLGRYGDSLNPHGDIEAAVQTWCLLRPGGIFLLGLPATDPLASKDELVWNAHRHYGPLRLAEMFAGYELREFFYIELHSIEALHILGPSPESQAGFNLTPFY